MYASVHLDSVQFEFVEYIPSKLAEGTVYISIPYRTTAHLLPVWVWREGRNPAPTQPVAALVRRGHHKPLALGRKRRACLPVSLLDRAEQGSAAPSHDG